MSLFQSLQNLTEQYFQAENRKNNNDSAVTWS